MSIFLSGLSRLVDLPQVHDPRGNLTAIENQIEIPFEIKRVYYLYDVPSGAERGGHAHKNLKQLLIAASGSFNITISDGKSTEVITLNRPNQGLLIESMVWREMNNFSSGSVCLVLASEPYSEDDYYREYEDFMKAAQDS